MRKWKVGDVVRVVHHRSPWLYKHVIGMVFRIERFSTMDYCEDCPTIPNPLFDRHETDRKRRMMQPMYIRFEPEWLEEAGVLDQLTII